MRTIHFMVCIILMMALAACGENGLYRATLITEGEHVVGRGERLEGLLLLMGGNMRLDPGAFATGPLYVLDGALVVEGEVAGDVAILGGALRLGPQARTGGTVNVSGGEVDISPTATIAGTTVTASEMQLPLSPGWSGESRGRQLTWFLLNTLGLALPAAVAARVRPRPLARVAQAVREQPVALGAFGVLVGLVAPVLLVLMAFTILLIPLALLGFGLLLLAIAYGLIGVGVWVGEQFGERVAWRWSPSLRAFAGTALVMLFVTVASLLPLLGGLIPLLMMSVALGAALLTRFGGRRFIPAIEEMPEVEEGAMSEPFSPGGGAGT